MRYFGQVFALFVLSIFAVWISPSNSYCQMKNWWHSFEDKGWSSCDSYIKYIKGLWRNSPNSKGHPIGLLEEAKCCTIPSAYWYSNPVCTTGDWSYTLNSGTEGGSYCPSGYFVQGLFRDKGEGLHVIEYAKCCKPAGLPDYYSRCYWKDVSTSFNVKGLSECDENYYLVGLYKSKGDALHNIDKFKCCSMYPSKVAITSLAKAKTYVMENTLFNLAYLANYLGYGWCAGCRGQWVGEEFIRQGDSWNAANTGPFCHGYKASHRLKLHYRDFKLKIRSITFGQGVKQTLKPQVYLTGVVRNSYSHPTKVTIKRQVTSTRSVTHTKTSAWTSSHEIGAEIGYTPGETGGVGAKVSYKFKYETSSTTKDSKNKEDVKSFTLTAAKTVPATSTAQWNIMITKSRYTVPYTAVVIVHFSAEMDGFLRWGGGYNGASRNFHRQHRGGDDRPTVHYKFGGSTIPFYKALKDQAAQNANPWDWNDMKNHYTSTPSLINKLSNENHYVFTLTGKFTDVIGTHADIKWTEANKLGKRGLDEENDKGEAEEEEEAEEIPDANPKPPEVDISTKESTVESPPVHLIDDADNVKKN